MLYCDVLKWTPTYTREAIPFSQILCDDPLQISEPEKVRLTTFGQLSPLVVIPQGDRQYFLLEGGADYAAMLALRQEDKERFAAVDCLVVDTAGLSDIMRALIIGCQQLENLRGRDDRLDKYRLRVVDLLLERIKRNEMKRSDLAPTVEKLFSVSRRYAKMYIAISSSAIPELREAVIAPSSGRQNKYPHIPAQAASLIASFPPEEQRDQLSQFAMKATKKQSSLSSLRGAVSKWLCALQEQLELGHDLSEADQALLEQVRRFGQDKI